MREEALGYSHERMPLEDHPMSCADSRLVSGFGTDRSYSKFFQSTPLKNNALQKVAMQSNLKLGAFCQAHRLNAHCVTRY
jgi:hypothetical protein